LTRNLNFFSPSFVKGNSKKTAEKMKGDQKLLSAAVMMVVMKILSAPDRILNRLFDAVTHELNEREAPGRINSLSAIIFDFIKLDQVKNDR
jgi:hypothetical protein